MTEQSPSEGFADVLIDTIRRIDIQLAEQAARIKALEKTVKQLVNK